MGDNHMPGFASTVPLALRAGRANGFVWTRTPGKRTHVAMETRWSDHPAIVDSFCAPSGPCGAHMRLSLRPGEEILLLTAVVHDASAEAALAAAAARLDRVEVASLWHDTTASWDGYWAGSS